MNDGYQANTTDRGAMADRNFERRRDVDAPSMSVLSEIHARLSALEESNEQMRGIVDDAIKSGHLDADLSAKVAHVMTKYFPHDNPETEVVAPPSPKFDAFTGQPLN